MTLLPPLTNEDRQHLLKHTEGLWEPLYGQRMLITGGTGFLGTWLLHSFVWAQEAFDLKARLVVLTRNVKAFRAKVPYLADHPSITFQQGNVCDFDFPQGEFRTVIHGAAETYNPAAGVDRMAIFDRDVQGMRRVLDFARQRGTRQLLLISSGSVYGQQPHGLCHVSEDYSGAPDTMNSDVAYGHAKRVGEFLGATYAQKYGLEFKVARCFTSVGPYIPLDFNYAVGNFIRDGLSGSPIVVRGDGTPYRTYLYTSDLTIWLWNILFRGEICRPYNVGSEEAISIADLARLVAGCFRHKPEVQLLGSAVPGRQAERYVPSCARARTELALQQLIGMREAILRTARWHAPQFSASSVDSLES